METWPNFFIAGLEKSGTTSLYEYLKQINGIYLSPIKEPWYFAPNVVSTSKNHILKNKITKKNSYLDLFKDVKNQKAIGEASAVYWRDPDSANLIYQKIPNAKLIFSIRDPIDRIFSQYLMNLSSGLTNSSFHKYIKLRYENSKKIEFLPQLNKYTPNLQRFYDFFEKSKIKIIIFEFSYLNFIYL